MAEFGWPGHPATGTAPGAGMDLIVSQSFSAVSSVSVNNCFSSTYGNYQMVLNFVGSTTGTTSLRMRASGTDTSGSVYDRGFNYGYYGGAGISGTASAAQTSVSLVNGTDTNQQGIVINFMQPQAAVRTLAQYSANVSDIGGLRAYVFGGFQVVDTVQYDGLSLTASAGTITGTVRVYGYRN